MNAFPATKGRAGRELLAAGGLYLAVLGFALGSKWVSGQSFLTEVIWDPTPVYFQYPMDHDAIQSLLSGQLPIWDSTRGLGTPSFVPVHATFTSLLKILVYLFHTPRAWEGYLFLRLFLAGIFTYILARALPIRFAGAILAGAAYMLCGFFRVFLTFQHLNLEAFFPILLWSLLALFRRPTLLGLLAALLFLHQIWTGGNPTAIAYAMVYGPAFFTFLAVLKAHRSSQPWRRAGRWLFLYLLLWAGAGLWAGNYLLPGFEFAGQTWLLRRPDISHLYVPLSNLVALLTPGFDYWLSPLPANRETQLAVLNFVPSYLGLIVSAFALLAVLHPARLPRTGLFFIPALFFTLSLVFGIPPFNLVGQLPILRYSQNFRYIQSFLALSTALAAGMGLHLFFTSGAAIHRRTLFGIGLVFSVGILWNLAVFRLQILSSPLLPRLALAAGLALAGLAAVLLAARFLFSVKSRRSLAAVGLTAAAMAELLIYFHLATPLYGPHAYSPAEPPAAVWLRQKPGWFRLLGTDPEALHPNLAGLFGLEDVRDSTPVYTRRYLQLVSALDGLQTPGAILANYFENGRFYLDFDLSRIRPPLLDLLNVRYLLSPKARDRQPLPLDDKTAHGLAPASGQHYLARIEAVINGVRRPALFTHAPSRADLPLPRPRGGALVFDVGVLPEALRNPNLDGVFMLAAAQTGAGATLVFSRFLNPRREAGEREWIPLETPLPSAAAALSLLALPGPRDNRQNDFAVWGEPGLRQADPWPTLALVYDRDLRIYENRTARPRAFWVPAAEWLASDEAVLRRLTAKEFDPGQAALIHARPPLPKLDSPAGSAEVELLGHEWGRAWVRVSAKGAGFLVLSDLYYPGWEARLDGAEVRLYPVDLALRGLPVPAGEHEVLFRYNPISVHLAVWATLVAYSFAPLLLILHKFFPPKAPRAKESEPAPAEAEAKKAGVCPGCGQSLVRPWLNSVTGLFECRSCGAIFRPLSELPPPEAYYTEDYYFKA